MTTFGQTPGDLTTRDVRDILRDLEAMHTMVTSMRQDIAYLLAKDAKGPFIPEGWTMKPEDVNAVIADYDLYLFDVDGTLVTTKSGETFRKTADDWVWIDGRKDRVQALITKGKQVSLVTNQGGVGFGYFTTDEMDRELGRTVAELFGDTPAVFRSDHVRVCYSHPKAKIAPFQIENDFYRKPNPGMLLGAMQDWHIGPRHTVMVGDRPEDRAAAAEAGCDFIEADVFFTESAVVYDA
jgi:D-glycero-D-manno-heptose 1,7-bisphosphate phosphatase